MGKAKITLLRYDGGDLRRNALSKDTLVQVTGHSSSGVLCMVCHP